MSLLIIVLGLGLPFVIVCSKFNILINEFQLLASYATPWLVMRKLILSVAKTEMIMSA